MNFTNTDHYYLSKNKKVKNEIILVYEDNCLKKDIYVLNSNLPKQSYLRKKQLITSKYFLNINSISIFQNPYNYYNIFHLYPARYIKNSINNSKFEINFFSHYYKYKTFINKSFKDILQNNFFKKKRKFSLIWSRIIFLKKNKYLKWKIIKKLLFKYWKRSFYVGFNGSIFYFTRRFIRVNSPYNFFRGGLNTLFVRFIKIYLNWIQTEPFLNKKLLNGKLLIYKFYFMYLYKLVDVNLKKINRRRLNKKGPFYFYLLSRLPFFNFIKFLSFPTNDYNKKKYEFIRHSKPMFFYYLIKKIKKNQKKSNLEFFKQLILLLNNGLITVDQLNYYYSAAPSKRLKLWEKDQKLQVYTAVLNDFKKPKRRKARFKRRRLKKRVGIV